MNELKSELILPIKFSEVDSMRVVWHGHYLRYFEDGREDFGSKHNLRYLDVYDNDMMIPIVRSSVDHRKPLFYGDSVRIETTFVNSPAAKIHFRYRLYSVNNGHLVANGETTQVFLDKSFELIITTPPFFADWKKKWGLK